jgi:mitogen-activated protein kinase 1/3
LILLCDYSKPVDMWSVGCILAELLGMQSESVPDFQMRAPLFPGASCPSLSGDGLTDPFNTSNFVGHGTETDYDRVDQLNLILDVIGTPSEECIGSVRNPTTEKFLRGLRKRPAQSLSRRYPGAPPEAISLLQQMLHFDPAKRLTVEQALAHPYMKAVRDEVRTELFVQY